MNKRVSLTFLLLGLGLTSCTDTAQLYKRADYLSGSFVEHCYNVWEGATRQGHEEIAHSKELSLLPYEKREDVEGYFSGSGSVGELSTCYGYDHAFRYHPEYFYTPEGNLLSWGYSDPSDIVPGGFGVWADNSPRYNTVYSQNKRLDRFYENFSRGFVSKFYNGQIKCDGWSYYAMAVLSTDGYGTLFPYELVNAEYFAMSVLMGTDLTESEIRRVTVADIDITFYKYSDDGQRLIGYQVLLDDVNLSCNNSSANTSLVGFTFADAGINPKGIVGMSMNWSLVDDPSGAHDDFSAEGYHDGICLYEVLFPDSTWN